MVQVVRLKQGHTQTSGYMYFLVLENQNERRRGKFQGLEDLGACMLVQENLKVRTDKIAFHIILRVVVIYGTAIEDATIIKTK